VSLSHCRHDVSSSVSLVNSLPSFSIHNPIVDVDKPAPASPDMPPSFSPSSQSAIRSNNSNLKSHQDQVAYHVRLQQLGICSPAVWDASEAVRADVSDLQDGRGKLPAWVTGVLKMVSYRMSPSPTLTTYLAVPLRRRPRRAPRRRTLPHERGSSPRQTSRRRTLGDHALHRTRQCNERGERVDDTGDRLAGGDMEWPGS
jgi:hypothetical protein